MPEGHPGRACVSILNPISEEQSVMRTSMVPGLLEAMGRNLAVQNRSMMLYEIGNTFFATDQADRLPAEKEMLTVLWTGARAPFSWHGKPEDCDFFDMKGVAEALLGNLGIREAEFTQMPTGECHDTRPGATARIRTDGRTIGRLGEIAPAVLKRFDLGQKAYILEFALADLLREGAEAVEARAIAKFPATARDITLIIAREIESAGLTAFVEQLDEKLVESIAIFDVYTGKPIEAGKKSISMRITYRSEEGTLEDRAVNDLHGSISRQLIEAFKASLPA